MTATRSSRKAQTAAATVETRSQRIHALELKAQAQAHSAEIAHKQEDERRLRVKSVLAQGDKSDMEEALRAKDVEIEALTARCLDMEGKLEASEQKCSKLDGQVKSQSRDISLLRAEVESLNTSSHDSAKILTEKLTLSRELTNLKPELEHLQTQLAGQQKAIAEKLALERQVVSLEVELETEKRAKQRVMQNNSSKEELNEMRLRVEDLEKKLLAEKKEKERLKKDIASNSDASDEKDELATKIKDLEKKLASAVKEKERVRKDGERELADANANSESLEQRLESTRDILRDVREELRTTKARLDAGDFRHAFAAAADIPEKSSKIAPGGRKPSKKRAAEEIEDITIATPGIAEGKSKKSVQAQVGQKSTFSITPFLNRTKGPGEESTMALELESPVVPANEPAPSKATAAKTKPKSRLSEVAIPEEEEEEAAAAQPAKQSKPRVKAKKNSDSTATGAAIKAGKKQPAKTIPELPDEDVAEDDDGEGPEDSILGNKNPPAKTKTLKPKALGTLGKSAATRDSEQVKKKRKILDAGPKTLFDDDDDDTISMPPPPKRGTRPNASGAGARVLSKSALNGLKKGAFGSSFSPLKKDRRGVGASFIA
ncbi:hypothetical protein BROUX41_002267 [Berkeleyomyces rouxiae]